MRHRLLLSALAFGLVLCLAGAPAQAQDSGKISLFAGYSYMQNNWGNGCAAACSGGLSTGLHGYSLSGVYNFTKNFGMEANFSGHNGSPTVESEPAVGDSDGFRETESQDIYTYTFGPRVTLPLMKNISLYSHFLVGGVHGHEGFTDRCVQATGGETCSTVADTSFADGNGMAFKTGAGANWNHGRWGIQILEVDYVHASAFVTEHCAECTQPNSFEISGNNFELSTGVTFNFR